MPSVPLGVDQMNEEEKKEQEDALVDFALALSIERET
jgi:hypothetical protein